MLLDLIGEDWAVALIGAIGGIALGLAARLGRFCTLGAIEDFFYSSSALRLQMWVMAIGVAVAGAFGLSMLGLFDANASVYINTQWNPIASVIGGLMFGYGMAIAGNCGYGALARLGGGDIRAFVIVLVIGVAAYVMASGPLAELRVALFPPIEADQPQGLAHWVGGLTGISPAAFGLTTGLAIIVAALSMKSLRTAPREILWSVVVGLAIVGAWGGTFWVAETGFGDVSITSHSFSRPVGDTLIYGMLSSGLSISFGVGSVMGVVAGAAIGSLIKGQFRWEACDDPRELRRQMTGGWLMGFGAVLSVGCSVGQGLSAMSVLAFSAPVALAAIFAGAWIGLRQLVEGLAPAE